MEMQRRLKETELENVFGGIIDNEVQYRPNGPVVVYEFEYFEPLYCDERGVCYGHAEKIKRYDSAVVDAFEYGSTFAPLICDERGVCYRNAEKIKRC